MEEKSRLFFWINFVLCGAGVILFLYFAFGVERAGSRANAILSNLLTHDILVVVFLILLCLGVCIPFLQRGGKNSEK